MIKTNKIFESPDNLRLIYKNKVVRSVYDVVQAKPFTWKPKRDKDGMKIRKNKKAIMGGLWVGDYGDSHMDCEFLTSYGGVDLYDDLINPGRIWFKNDEFELNVISFWEITQLTKEEVKRCIVELSDELNVDFSNWSIDVGVIDSDYGMIVDLIPLKDFKGGIVLDERQRQINHLLKLYHTSSGMDKIKIRKKLEKLNVFNSFKGIGSDYYIDKLKGVKSLTGKGVMSVAEWNYMRTTEKVNIKTYNELFERNNNQKK